MVTHSWFIMSLMEMRVRGFLSLDVTQHCDDHSMRLSRSFSA